MMSPACGCQQSVRLEQLLSEAAADSWPHSGLAEFLSIADVTRRSCDLHQRGDDPVGVGVVRAPHLTHAAAAQQLDKAITPERRALHRLTIRSQTLHRQAFETPAGAMWSRPCSIGEVPRRLYGPNLRGCATSTPSTPSCGCWPLCAVRSASMVASRRVVRSMNCSTSACSLLADRLVR